MNLFYVKEVINLINLGEKIIGKWNNNKYLVIKKIGSGGIGEVYKVKDEFNKSYAIKISSDMTTINREYNIMKKLECFNHSPKVYDLDDYESFDGKYYFIVMDYIEGLNLKDLMRKKGIDITNIIGITTIILYILKKIYEMGYVYCDIKLENILLDMENNKIMLIDYGGVIEKDNNIREFTPVYNISSWGIDINGFSYEKMMIFSVSMLMVSMILKREFNPLITNINNIFEKVKGSKFSNVLKQIIIKGLNTSYNNIDDFIKDLNKVLLHIKDNNKRNKVNKRIDVLFNVSIVFFILILIFSGIKLIN